MFTQMDLRLVREGINPRDGAAAVEPGQTADPAATLRHDGDEHQAPGALRPELLSIVFPGGPAPAAFRNAGGDRLRHQEQGLPGASIACDRDVAGDTDFAPASCCGSSPSSWRPSKEQRGRPQSFLLLNGASLKLLRRANMFRLPTAVDGPPRRDRCRGSGLRAPGAPGANIITVETAMTTRPRAGDSTDIGWCSPRTAGAPGPARHGRPDRQPPRSSTAPGSHLSTARCTGRYGSS